MSAQPFDTTQTAAGFDSPHGARGLSWSGRWHIIRGEVRGSAVAMCGTVVFRRGFVPRYHATLLSLAQGRLEAPECKKCAKSVSR